MTAYSTCLDFNRYLHLNDDILKNRMNDALFSLLCYVITMVLDCFLDLAKCLYILNSMRDRVDY